MPALVRDGITLAYDDRGAGKPALLFIHGWSCDRSFFAPQAEHFARRHRVVSLDLRGHGESDKPRGEYPIAAFADDAAYVVERLDLGRVVAVGHSMGGLTVLQLAAAHPERVAAVVLVDPAPLAITPEARARLGAIAEAGDPALRERLVLGMFLPTSDRGLVARVREIMLAAPSHVAAAAMRGVIDFDGRAAAAQCKVPALHVAGTPPVNPPHVLAECLPNAVHGWTVGAGHFNQLEAPDQVNAMIEAFLRHYV